MAGQESCRQLGMPEAPEAMMNGSVLHDSYSPCASLENSATLSKEVGKNVGLHWDLI